MTTFKGVLTHIILYEPGPALDVEILNSGLRLKKPKKGPIPKYSTDIAAAWEVVKLFESAGDFIVHMKDMPVVYQVTISIHLGMGSFKEVTVTGTTAPHAICLAALEYARTRS